MCRAISEGGARCAGRHGISDRVTAATAGIMVGLTGSETSQDNPTPEQETEQQPKDVDSLRDILQKEGFTSEDLQAKVSDLREKLAQARSPESVRLAETTEDPDVLRLLAEAEDDEVREAISENPHTPEELKEELPELAADTTRWERVKKVADAFTPKQLDNYSKDKSVWVRLAVLLHPNVGADTITALSKDPNPFVRLTVALLPSTSKQVWEELKNDPHPMVRFGARDRADRYRAKLAKELKKTSVVSTLSKDEILILAKDRQADPALLNEIQMVEKDKTLIAAVAANPRTPAKALADIHHYHGDAEVLEAVGSNKNTSQETLAKMTDHYDPDVRASVAGNTAASKEVLETLSKDRSPSVRAGLASNSSYVSDPNKLQALAKDRSWQVKAAVGSNPNTNSQTLTKLSKSRDVRVKLTVAKHPNTDEATLRRLRRSSDKKVAKAAKTQLVRLKTQKKR